VPQVVTLGVRDLVIPWGARQPFSLVAAQKLGYRVYAEITLEQASALAGGTELGLAGFILKAGNSGETRVEDAGRKLRLAYPDRILLILGPEGKQPQMRGSTIIKRDGVLEVTSPTAQPWIDSNLALVRFDRAFFPSQAPLLTFPWFLPDDVQHQEGPGASDYALAVAEAGAFHADVILTLNGQLEKALAQGRADGGAVWNQVKRYLEFYLREAEPPVTPQANVGVMTDNYEKSYEAMNLMARRNIPFLVLRPSDLTKNALAGLDLLVLFAPPAEPGTIAMMDWVAGGGVAILVAVRGSYPWQSTQPSQRGEHWTTYAVGKGRVIELSEPVSDPETFAQDVRRLLDKPNVLIGLWNALTTLAVPYQQPGSPNVTLDLVNYAEDPLEVQVRVKGSFSAVRYETPEHGCCESLTPARHNGFTEFVVPWLRIGGRVHLAAATSE
jgi:hypothetical protein